MGLGVRFLLIGASVAAVLSPASVAATDCTPAATAVERFVEFENRFGEKIAVDLYFPADATGDPLTSCRFPLVLESSPYRDWTSPQPTKVDEDTRRTWWVQRGYVYAFADVPGSGGSDGTWCLLCEREQLSGMDIVNALGEMPWSNGKVGMIGGSYPGITALLVAQHKPEHLKAVIAANVLEDLYSDLFFVGGMPRAEDAAVLMSAFTGLSRWTGRYDASDPQRSAEIASDRNSSPPPSFATFQLDHPSRDAFWVQRSVRAEDVEVPVFMIGGWNDIFDRATWEMYDRLGSDTKVLVQGPFTHVSFFMPPGANLCAAPNQANCGWPLFDRFLKGVSTPDWAAYEADPMRWYEQPNHGYRAGPAKPATSDWAMPLGTGSATLRHDPASGTTSGRWFARGSVPGAFPPLDSYLGVDGPADQRAEGATALSVSSDPLDADVTLAGGGRLHLTFDTQALDADIVVRIVDEYPVGRAPFPAGYATLVTSGWLRASHRDGHANPAPLTPGTSTVDVEIWPSGYRFAAGHRIRVDIYTSDVPRFVPLAQPFELDVDLGASFVELEMLS